MKDVYHQIAEIEQNPSARGSTLAPKGLDANFEELVFDLASNGLHVAFISTGCEKEDVGKRKGHRDIKGYEILALLRISG